MKNTIYSDFHRMNQPEQTHPVEISGQYSGLSNSEKLAKINENSSGRGYRPGTSNSDRLQDIQQPSPSFPIRTILQMGSRGEIVRQLQACLQQKGYSIRPDGVFGPQTEKALRAFQRANNLKIDGVAGPETLSRLGSISDDLFDNESEEVPNTQTTHHVFPGESLWSIANHYYGDGGRWREIATANQLSDASILRVGMVLNIPNAESRQVDSQPKDAPIQPSPSFPIRTILQMGSRGEIVRQLQACLQQKGYSIRPDGVFGPQTEKALRAFQRANNLKIDGVAGPETLSRLGSISDDLFDNESEEVPNTQTTHHVFPGESLWSIANHYYGDGGRWREIATANQLSDASILRVGMVLNIPNAESRQVDSQPKDAPINVPQPSNNAMSAPDPIDISQLSGLELAMAKIYNEKGAYLFNKAQAMGVSTSAVAAVLQCESNGRAFSGSGDMIIRFENHIFWDKWGQANPQQFADHFQFNPNKRWTNQVFRPDSNSPWESFHDNQSKEWAVLNLARDLSDSAALESISMGAAQVMGFNYQMVGYDSVQEMFEAMSTSLPAQLDGMFSYIAASPTCMRGLENNDFYTFARGYNGAKNAQTYGNLITIAEQHYRRITQGREMV